MSNPTIQPHINRRELLARGALIGGAGFASLALPASADAGQAEQNSAAVGHIYRLQAAFHRAKSTQDIDLMMSIWDPNGTLTVQGDPNSPYIGFDQLKAFWLGSGSFTHRRFSLVPSFKIQIAFHEHTASLYFECHDIGDYDQTDRFIASDTFLAGTIHRAAKDWIFYDMTAGNAAPLSVDHYYHP
jgi:hypothetical protein